MIGWSEEKILKENLAKGNLKKRLQGWGLGGKTNYYYLFSIRMYISSHILTGERKTFLIFSLPPLPCSPVMALLRMTEALAT